MAVVSGPDPRVVETETSDETGSVYSTTQPPPVSVDPPTSFVCTDMTGV